MFTGIIEEIGVVSRRSGSVLEVLAETVISDASLGDSIAINGACMTIAELKEKSFVVQVSPESFDRTTLGDLRPGHAVNLERAMQAGGRFGGHFVAGHVDGVGKVEKVTPQGEFSLWGFRAPDEVARYLTPKGSVTIDGISLTVVEPKGDRFAVAIIPSTLAKTTLHTRAAGDRVNMEADMIGKHIWHFMNHGGGGISQDFLKNHGYA
ncbi:MAG: riboflavin synthase [Candidatus Hydrogenedens sp.]|nr:riboflavin synthase [Candidatus Hydrogenedens sp.]